MNDSLIRIKQNFIEYILVLNQESLCIKLFKANQDKLNNVHFVNSKINNHYTLEIAEVDATASAIQSRIINLILIQIKFLIILQIIH